MANIVLGDSTVIGDYLSPYFVAEVNSSHGGSLETARRMIEEAGKSGCSGVKFQSWSDDSLYSKTYYNDNPIAKRLIKKFSLREADLKELALYCLEVGVSFSSTPYSPQEVDWLLECGAPYIKISSMEINNHLFLKYIAETGSPIILSTGMAEMEEIRAAVSVVKKAGNRNLALLHCVSIYPAPASAIHLNNIIRLREEFPECPIGFSDHTLGTEIAAAATALGAALIEKHFTLDKTKMGLDNNMAIEPTEMKQLVGNCLNVHQALGACDRVVSTAEREQRRKMRRSVIAARDLPAGTVLALADLAAKRPGDGIPVHEMENLVGRTLARGVEADTLLRLTDLTE